MDILLAWTYLITVMTLAFFRAFSAIYHTLYIEFLNLMARKLIVRKQREVGNMASVLLIT